MTHAQPEELRAAGVTIPEDSSEFRITPEQAELVFIKIRERIGAEVDSPEFERFAIFLQEVSDPYALRARTEGGYSKPYFVTIYELGSDGLLDRSQDYFYFSA